MMWKYILTGNNTYSHSNLWLPCILSILNIFCIEYGHLDFWTKTWFGERPFNLSIQNLLCTEYGYLDFWANIIWGKPFYFVHPKFTLLCMSILTLEQILIWVLVLVLVLDMKVLDVLKYFFKKWVLDQYLYLVYIWGTWCTWVLGLQYLTPTLVFYRLYYPMFIWISLVAHLMILLRLQQLHNVYHSFFIEHALLYNGTQSQSVF